MTAISVRSHCVNCGQPALSTIMDFGRIPLAGAFPLTADDVACAAFPLSLSVCQDCYLVQVPEDIPQEVMFRDYRYLASIPLARHFEAFATHVPKKLGLPRTALIVEVGCNDGVLLHPLREHGFPNLVGIDPAANVTQHVDDRIEVVTAFFDRKVADGVVGRYGRADLVVANNVFAHIPDPHVFLDAVHALLDVDGTFVFEVHYLLDLIEKNQFDTVYHEHRYYYSLTVLADMLARHGLSVVDVERITNHGGSIRVFAGRRAPTAEVNELLAEEAAWGVHTMGAYRSFAQRAATAIRDLRCTLDTIGTADVVAAYGAAGRSVTLLNLLGESAARVRYVVDDSPERAGRVVPGVGIPIVPASRLVEEPPSVVLVTAWTYADQIAERVRQLLDPPPRLLIPLPTARFA